MAKGYIVVDVPAKCAYCRFAVYPISNGVCKCNMVGKYIDVSDEEKPDWCPIRPQPERREGSAYWDSYWNGVADGRNNLIGEMFGEVC